MVRTESSLIATLVGAKDFAIVGGNNTVNVALAAATFVKPPAAVRPPAGNVLRYEPAVADVTLTVTMQVLLAGIVAPEIANDGPLLAAVTVASGQVVAPAGAPVLVSPTG